METLAVVGTVILSIVLAAAIGISIKALIDFWNL